MDRFIANLRRQAEENPVLALGAGAALLQTATKLLSATAAHRNSKAWKKEVDRRASKSKK